MDRAAVERTARLEARQRELERRVRKYKRLAEGTLEPEKAAGYRRAVQAAQKDNARVRGRTRSAAGLLERAV